MALQWGHPCEGTEMLCQANVSSNFNLLQWGHPCEGTEMTSPRTTRLRSLGFNGAIPVKGRKSVHQLLKENDQLLQWGHPCEGTEIRNSNQKETQKC